MEYYLAMRKNEIWPFAVTWMQLEGIMPSEISQRKTDTICFHFTHLWILRNLTEGHGGGEEGKKKGKSQDREGGKP